MSGLVSVGKGHCHTNKTHNNPPLWGASVSRKRCTHRKTGKHQWASFLFWKTHMPDR